MATIVAAVAAWRPAADTATVPAVTAATVAVVIVGANVEPPTETFSAAGAYDRGGCVWMRR